VKIVGAQSIGESSAVFSSSWTLLNVAKIKKPMPIDNLTPSTLYAVQLQTLGKQGLPPWSDSSTIMCP